MSSKPYLLVSDIHFHRWSQFSTTLASGVNSRLQIIIDELLRASKELLARGGDVMCVAGDTFHVRGSISPEVFNPVHEAFSAIADSGVRVLIIPGNHDLASRDTTVLGNAIQTLGALDNIQVVTNSLDLLSVVKDVCMIPWVSTKEGLLEQVQALQPIYNVSQTDLIIHAGVDGVLPGMPGSGLTSAEVASWGFKRVFAGHYHNHKEMEGGKVVSIGALTHQTWSDIGTKAGFLFVYPDRIEYRASQAPAFVEITEANDIAEIPLLVDGNYVRVRDKRMTDSEINELRQDLLDMGARGVSFQVVREVATARSGTAVAKAATLDESVETFIDKMEIEDAAQASQVKAEAADVLSTVRSVSA